jgi:hypothetical protein
MPGHKLNAREARQQAANEARAVDVQAIGAQQEAVGEAAVRGQPVLRNLDHPCLHELRGAGGGASSGPSPYERPLISPVSNPPHEYSQRRPQRQVASKQG